MAARRAIAWLGLRQARFVRTVARLAGLELAGVGLGEPGDGRELSRAMGAPLVDDLRSALLGADVDLVWIARAGDFGEPRQAAADARALAGAGARGVRVVTSEPLPTRVQDLSINGWRDGALAWVGMPRGLGCVHDLACGLETIGPVRAAMVRVGTTPSHTSLSTALVGAMELLVEVLGEPETVHGAYASSRRAPGVHAMAGDRVEGLHGEIFATLRYGSGRGAGLWCTDGAGIPGASLVVMGGAGTASATALGDREDLAMHREPGEGAGETAQAESTGRLLAGEALGGGADGPLAPEALAGASLFHHEADWLARRTSRDIVRVLDGSARDGPPNRTSRVLAMAQACLLSVRTGQGESPEVFLRDVDEMG